MAEGIGVDGIHCVSGTCDLCGDVCDANTQELNVLSCTFAKCEDLCYHQDCLEKYLKSIRLERNRKTGFKCPRGCGKGSAHKDPCPGKIDKSHPIHPRNEEQKKKKKSKTPEVVPVVPTRPKTKEERKAEKAAAAAAAAKAQQAAAADKGKAAKTAAGNLKAAVGSNSSNSIKAAKPPPPPDPRKQLAEALAAARRELAAGKQSREPTPPSTAAPATEYKTLDMYYRENAAASSSNSLNSTATAPVANAWAKPPVPAPVATRHKSAGAAADPSISRLHIAHSVSAPGLHTTQSSAHSSALPSRAESPVSAAAVVAGAAATTAAHFQPPPPPPDAHHGLAAAGRAGSSASIPAAGVHSSSSSSAAMAAAAVAANGTLPVGMEYLSEDEQQHLTKAQRKNLKRAEKKKRQEAATGNLVSASSNGDLGSHVASVRPGSAGGASSSSNAGASSSTWASPNASGAGANSRLGAAAAAAGAGPADDVDAESSELMYELAVQALLAHKTLDLVASLQRLGFTEWQAAAAVQRHGSDIEDAVAWLLDGGAPNAAAAAAVSQGCVAQVEIAEDLALMEQLANALTAVPKHKLYQAVADTGGDLDAAAAVCLQQAATAEAEAVAAAAEDAAAAANGPSSNGYYTYAGSLMGAAAAGQSSQQIASSELDAVDSSSLFNSQPSLYSSAAAAAAPTGLSSLTTADNAYSGWLGDGSQLAAGNGSSSFATSTAAGQGPASSSSLGFLAPSTTAVAAAAGLGSSIWASASDSQSAVGNSIWGQAGTSSSLFGVGSSSTSAFDNQLNPAVANLTSSSSAALRNPGVAGSLGLGSLGTPSLELGLGLLNPQQSLSAADPVLDGFGSGSTFNISSDANSAATAAAAAAANPTGISAVAAGMSLSGPAPALQGSRLFQSYGWRQQPLFADNAHQQQQQQHSLLGGLGSGAAAAAAVGAQHDVDETDLEGLMSTLMCH